MNPDMYMCNKCFKTMKSSNSSFSMTQCGHIFCSKCISSDFCPKCNVSGIRVMQLTNPLPTCVQSLFSGTVDIFQELIKINKFQSSQRELTNAQLTEVENKYGKLKKAYWQMTESARKITQICNELSEARKKCQATHELLVETMMTESIQNPSNNNPMSMNIHQRDPRESRVHFAPNLNHQQQQHYPMQQQNQRHDFRDPVTNTRITPKPKPSPTSSTTAGTNGSDSGSGDGHINNTSATNKMKYFPNYSVKYYCRQ